MHLLFLDFGIFVSYYQPKVSLSQIIPWNSFVFGYVELKWEIAIVVGKAMKSRQRPETRKEVGQMFKFI